MNTTKEFQCPEVSIIIPVYNSEQYLYRCMDSVVYQSFQNIEIIVVNNGSTDNSLSILQQYETDFPDKVRVVTIPHAERAGTGRNVGINFAKADYIIFSDSDDMMHPRAVENLYHYMIEGNYDLVYAPYIQIKENIPRLMRNKVYTKRVIKNETALIDAEPSPWAKIFKKSLLKKSGEYPSEFSFEDLAYFFVYTSKAEKIGYFPNPVYYYFWRTDSEVHTKANPRIAETILAEQYGLEHCEDKYKDIVSYIIAKRIINNMVIRWVFADRFLEELHTLWPVLSTNPLIYKDATLYKRLVDYYSRSEHQSPKNVFLNGFGNNIYDEQNISTVLKDTIYYDGCNVIVLNEDNCDINEVNSVKRAYKAGNMDYVAGYFALKKIYEIGGVYLGKNIEVDLPLNYTRHLNSFFAYESQNQFSQYFFGGHSGEVVFERLLQYYQSESSSSYNLSNYINICLCLEFKIPPDPKNRIHNALVSTFSPDAVVIPIFGDTLPDKKIHFCHYKLLPDTPLEELVSIPKESAKWLMRIDVDTKNFPSNAVKKELDTIKSSRSWKMLQWLKSKKNKGFGKLFYTLYLFVYPRIIKN